MPKSTEVQSRPDRPRIKVTQADIDRAITSHSSKCVVAQAIARQIPDAVYIDVDTQTIRFTRQGRRWAYLTPYAVQGYVIAFDAGDEIEPFDFTLSKNIAVARRKTTPDGAKVALARDSARRAQRRAALAPTPETEEAAQSATAAYDAARCQRRQEATGDGESHAGAAAACSRLRAGAMDIGC